MSTRLTEIYTSILRFAGLDVDDQGYVSMLYDEKRDPAFIDGLRIVLPLDYHLRNFNPKEKIIFHPLTENILRGESEVITKLKHFINVRLNFTIGIVSQALLNLVASPEFHSKLNPEQAELLTTITDSDDKTVTNFISLMVAGIKTTPERLFTNIYLKRGGTFNGKRYSRAGIVTFPFYQNLKEDKIDKIRVKDKETYKQLMEFIFPGLDQMEEYNFGSDSGVAPYLEALMRTSAKLASRLNDILILYKDFIDEGEKVMFDSDWMEAFQDLNSLTPEIRKIPVQFGNDGTTNITEEPKVEATQVVQHQVQAPVYQPAQQAYQPPAAPELRKSKRGLDFQSILQTNQAVAMTPNPLAPQMYQQQMQQMAQQQQQMPGWATPPQGMMPQQGMLQQPQLGQVVQTPQGVFIMTQGGLVPAVQTNQGWMPAQMPNMQQMPQQRGMSDNPSWAGVPNNYGYGPYR